MSVENSSLSNIWLVQGSVTSIRGRCRPNRRKDGS